MWIKIDKDHLPEKRKLIVGLWREQSMLCYRTDTDYVDVFHGCFTYAPPIWYAELPGRAPCGRVD